MPCAQSGACSVTDRAMASCGVPVITPGQAGDSFGNPAGCEAVYPLSKPPTSMYPGSVGCRAVPLEMANSLSPSRGLIALPNADRLPCPRSKFGVPTGTAVPSGITQLAEITLEHMPIADTASIGSTESSATPVSHPWHSPATQVVVQPRSHDPQRCVSFMRSLSHPSRRSLLQSPQPARQAISQVPATQVPVALGALQVR